MRIAYYYFKPVGLCNGLSFVTTFLLLGEVYSYLPKWRAQKQIGVTPYRSMRLTYQTSLAASMVGDFPSQTPSSGQTLANLCTQANSVT